MRRPALLPCKQHPGGSGNPPSATTSGREELADGEAHLLHPARDRANNRRGGAPRGERPASWDVRCLASACGRTSLARRRVPLHPSACRRSAPLIHDEGKLANLGGNMPREKEDACARWNGCSIVMRGLDPRIHRFRKTMDCRVSPLLRRPGNDEWRGFPRNDRWKCLTFGRLPPRLRPPYPCPRTRRRGATGTT